MDARFIFKRVFEALRQIGNSNHLNALIDMRDTGYTGPR